MKHQWLAYVIVAVLSIGAGVAIAGLPDSVPQSETIIPPTTTEAPEPTVPSTTTAPAVTTTSQPETTTTSTTGTTTTAGSTTTTIALPDRSEVVVAVANGSGGDGVAQRIATEIEGLGYTGVQAVTGNDPVDTTIVYFADANDDAALRLASDLGLPPEAIAPIATAPGTSGVGIVQLLVYVGADRR